MKKYIQYLLTAILLLSCISATPTYALPFTGNAHEDLSDYVEDIVLHASGAFGSGIIPREIVASEIDFGNAIMIYSQKKTLSPQQTVYYNVLEQESNNIHDIVQYLQTTDYYYSFPFEIDGFCWRIQIEKVTKTTQPPYDWEGEFPDSLWENRQEFYNSKKSHWIIYASLGEVISTEDAWKINMRKQVSEAIGNIPENAIFVNGRPFTSPMDTCALIPDENSNVTKFVLTRPLYPTEKEKYAGLIVTESEHATVFDYAAFKQWYNSQPSSINIGGFTGSAVKIPIYVVWIIVGAFVTIALVVVVVVLLRRKRKAVID